MLSTRMFSRLSHRVPHARMPVSVSSICRSIVTKSHSNPSSRVARASSIKPQFLSRFSTTSLRLEQNASGDQALVAKLAAELQLENDMVEFQEMPESVKTFLESGGFEVKDTMGQEEVELIKNFGNETIRVEFSISDLNMMNHDHMDEGNALFDEEVDEPELPESTQSGGAQSKSAKENNRVQVADEAMEDSDDEYTEEEAGPGFPAHINIIIEKPNAGALVIAAMAQDGMIVMENLIYHQKPELLKTKSAESNFLTEGLYSGPNFQHLDEDLQDLLEKYLDERGINTALALFIPDYIEYKEQREYLRWLGNVKSFVEA